MDFDFFDQMSSTEAQTFLKNFLHQERVGFLSMEPELHDDGIDTRFHVDNVEAVLLWIFGRLKTIAREPDASLPSWISHTPSYLRGLREFDDASKILVMRAAYFVGEAFIESFLGLSWEIGDAQSAVKNMPVVAGFKSSMEMSPIMVLENTYKRVIADGASTEDIPKMIRTWKGYLPVAAMM